MALQIQIDTIGNKLRLVASKEDVLEIFEIMLLIITSEFAKIYKNRFSSLIFEILIACEPYWGHIDIATNIFNFVQLMCSENNCRNAFQPFIIRLVDLIIFHSDKHNTLIRVGFDAFAAISVCAETAYWFNSCIFKLCELISRNFARPDIIKSGIAMLNCFAHNFQNQKILGCYITDMGRILSAYYRDIYILIELLKLFKIISNNHLCLIKKYMALLFCIFRRNNDTEIPTTGLGAELNEHIISVFCILAKGDHISRPVEFLSIIPTMVLIAYQQVSPRVVQIIMEMLSCVVKYDQRCRNFVHRYIPQLLNIMHIRQDRVNYKARQEFVAYRSALLKSGSKIARSVMQNIFHSKKLHWTMHISTFLSENVPEDVIRDIVLNGFRIIHCIHLNNEEIIIPYYYYLDKLFCIINPYKDNIKFCELVFLFINNFITNNNRIIWRNIALLIKYIKLLKKMAQHSLHKNKEIIRAIMQKIIAANTIRTHILKLRA